MGQAIIWVVRHFQKGHAVYGGNMSAELARQTIFADYYPPTEGRTGYQRPPNLKRAQAFARYLREEPTGFMTPVILNARRSLTFVPTQENPDLGFLLIEQTDLTAAIVDGQHRCLGIEEYLGDDKFSIPFMLFDQLDIEAEQKLFITINREQRRVSMSHVYFVAGGSDPTAELATRLESDPRSPWHHRVNLVGAKGTKRPVSLQSLRTALEALLQPGEVKVLPLDQQFDIALRYWTVVSLVWPEAWMAPRKSLLTKSLGTLAVAKLGGYLLPRCLVRVDGQVVLNETQLTDYLTRATGVNWMSDGTFQGYAGRHGADLVKHHLDGLIFSEGAD